MYYGELENSQQEPARVAHLVSAQPSMREVPTLIPVSTSLPFYVALTIFKYP